MSQNTVPVLVSEDVIYERSRADHARGLFLGRTAFAVTGAQQQVMLLRVPRPPTWLYDSYFASVYPVLEAYSLPSLIPNQSPAGTLALFRSTYQPPIVEPEYQRTDHQIFFRVQRTYPLQIQFGGFAADVLDLCDDPWKEWVHAPPSPEAALFPFRQIPKAVRGQQFNLFWNQPPSPRLEAEADSLRYPNLGVMPLRQTPAQAQLITTCGVFDIYDYGNGSILVAWPPFGGPLPDSYNVYVNGVLNQNVPNPLMRLAVITGLFGASYNGVVVTPATTYRIKIVAVSAGVEVSESPTAVTAQPTSTMLITPMKRVFPFPNTGNE